MANGSIVSRGGRTLKTDGMAIVMVFIGLIIGIVLLSSVADTETAATTTKTITNETVTLPSNVGGTLELTGREHISTTSIVNASNGSESWASNVTISDGLGSDGTKTVILTLDGNIVSVAGGNGTATINGSDANVTYVYGPEGYLDNSSDRSIMNAVIIFGALAALVFAVVVLIGRGSLKKMLGM